MKKNHQPKEAYRFKTARENMVSRFVSQRILTEQNIVQAFSKVPRHRFIDDILLDRAYDDQSLPIGNGQTISHPSIVARMIELLDIKSTDRVLEIGTGSGYQTAILAELAGKVISIELISQLVRKARKRLEDMGYFTIRIEVGDGSTGFQQAAPFDRIIVSAGSPSIPEDLKKQLSTDGRIVIPIGNRTEQKLILITKNSNTFHYKDCGTCKFVDLIGANAWPKL